MLRIVNLEEIQAILLRIPSLVDLQERQEPSFVQGVKEWLSELERVLHSNRMPAAGNVASLRGLLLSAERGVLPAGVELQGRPTRRKIRQATTAYVLRQAGDIASGVIHKDHERIAEAERLSQQLVALANAKGLIKHLPARNNLTEALKAIWRTLSTDPDLAPGTVGVEGLVGPHDALLVLDRTLTGYTARE